MDAPPLADTSKGPSRQRRRSPPPPRRQTRPPETEGAFVRRVFEKQLSQFACPIGSEIWIFKPLAVGWVSMSVRADVVEFDFASKAVQVPFTNREELAAIVRDVLRALDV